MEFVTLLQHSPKLSGKLVSKQYSLQVSPSDYLLRQLIQAKRHLIFPNCLQGSYAENVVLDLKLLRGERIVFLVHKGDTFPHHAQDTL